MNALRDRTRLPELLPGYNNENNNHKMLHLGPRVLLDQYQMGRWTLVAEKSLGFESTESSL